ncbi:protein LIM3-like [Aristolochia californica]|uniref:protein LIM3-like n=1 Tax=Aristolochia californica TaxID=171875 RepID=UPI0035E2463A
MASLKSRYFLLLAAAVVGIMVSEKHIYAEDCSEDFKALALACAKFVTVPGPKVPPSPECCKVIQSCNLPCVCSHVNKDIEKFISVEKVAFVANSCNRPLPSGSKCGSKKLI